MIILSNCLTDTADEGTRKVATNLVRLLKQQKPDTTVITYESTCNLSTVHLKLNKLLLNQNLRELLAKKGQPLLYIPSPAKSLPLAIRLFILSRAVKKELAVLLTMSFPVDFLSKGLIKASKAKLMTLCEDSQKYYSQVLDTEVKRLNAGVDMEHFSPATQQQKAQYRKQYGLPQDKPIVLHVGHLKQGRNVAQLLKLDDRFHGVLVVSTQTADEQDGALRQQLVDQKNLTLIDQYIPNIEQIYQLSDVYLFPVLQEESCIDSPLSALEAAACGIPVVTTAFGELKALLGREGFYEISSFDAQDLNELLQKAICEKKNPRAAVLPYDWNNAVKTILER